MNLLGDWVYPVALMLLVAAIGGATFLAWRSSRRLPRLAGLAVSGLAVTLASALACLSVALMLNHDNGWYSSPEDLFGASSADSRAAGAKSADDTFGRGAAAQLARTDTRALPALPSPGQRVQEFTVPASVGAASWKVRVVLPEDYFAPEASTKTYPVLMAGHGMPGATTQWLGVVDIRRFADPLVAQRALAAPIVVIPELEPGGQDTECIFGPGGAGQVETWLARDVPAFVKDHLRAIPQRAAWAWIGFSAGAWCGAMLTMRHPDTFGAAIMLGGYYEPWWQTKPPWAIPSATESQHDLINLAKTKPPAVALWVQTSKRDPESWPQTQKFLAAAKQPTLVTAVVDTSGGHTWSTWTPHITPALTWLGKTVPGFAPV